MPVVAGRDRLDLPYPVLERTPWPQPVEAGVVPQEVRRGRMVIGEERMQSREPARCRSPRLELAHLIELDAGHLLEQDPVLPIGHDVRTPETLALEGPVGVELANRVVEELGLGAPRLLVEPVAAEALEDEVDARPVLEGHLHILDRKARSVRGRQPADPGNRPATEPVLERLLQPVSRRGRAHRPGRSFDR